MLNCLVVDAVVLLRNCQQLEGVSGWIRSVQQLRTYSAAAAVVLAQLLSVGI